MRFCSLQPWSERKELEGYVCSDCFEYADNPNSNEYSWCKASECFVDADMPVVEGDEICDGWIAGSEAAERLNDEQSD